MIVLAFAFVAGLLTILAPCTLPVIPLVLGGAAGGGRRQIAGIFIGFGAAFLTVTVVFSLSPSTKRSCASDRRCSVNSDRMAVRS